MSPRERDPRRKRGRLNACKIRLILVKDGRELTAAPRIPVVMPLRPMPIAEMLLVAARPLHRMP
jgi:hypothetical protein